MASTDAKMKFNQNKTYDQLIKFKGGKISNNLTTDTKWVYIKTKAGLSGQTGGQGDTSNLIIYFNLNTTYNTNS